MPRMKKWFATEEVMKIVPAFEQLYEQYVASQPPKVRKSPTGVLKEKVAELEAKLAEAQPVAPETH